jgi:hypothetical protein
MDGVRGWRARAAEEAMAFDLSHGREIYDRWGRHPVEVYAWNGGSLFTAVATKTPDG